MTIERKILLAAALPVMFVMQLGASCDSVNNDDGGDRPVYRDDGPYRHDGPVYRDEGPVYRDNGPGRDDDRPHRIPRWADQVREGTGKQRWTADFDGTIYVYDAAKDFVPWTGPIRRGQEVVVRPDNDRIMIDDRAVYQQNLRRDGSYTIYFEREGRRDQYQRDHGDDRDRPGPPPRNGGPFPPGVGGGVPRGDVMQRGRGDLAIQGAPRDGTVFVYDEDDRRVVYTRDLRRGNSFQMFPGRDFVNVNSKRADDVSLRRDHNYSLYFKQN